MREVAIGTLALAKAMYRVELADVRSRDVVRLECVCVGGGGGGCDIIEEGLHGSRGGRPAEGGVCQKEV